MKLWKDQLLILFLTFAIPALVVVSIYLFLDTVPREGRIIP